MHPNYLETLNPFNLKRPPASWLAELWALDVDLVLFPSAMEPMYRLTRKAKDTAGIQTVVQRKANDGTTNAANLDTQTCWQHRLVPVTSIHPHANWSPILLQDLAAADMKRWGGHAAISDRLEAEEDAARAKADAFEADEARHIAGHTYRRWKWMTGQTIDPTARTRRTPGRQSGFKRVLETQGHEVRMTTLTAAEERMLVKPPPSPPRDRGLVQLTDG